MSEKKNKIRIAKKKRTRISPETRKCDVKRIKESYEDKQKNNGISIFIFDKFENVSLMLMVVYRLKYS